MTPDLREYVDAAELQSLYGRQPWRIARDGIAIWLVILLAMAASIVTGNLLVTIVAIAVIAGRQLALNNMVHEASHYLVARDKGVNDLVSDIFFAAPHMISTEGYRAKHLPHHQYLGHPPEDEEFKARFLFRGRRFFWRSLWVLIGGSSIVTAASYGRGAASANVWRSRVLIVLTNGALVLYCWSLGSPWAYVYLWLLPLLTLAGYLGTLRVVAEHQPLSYAQSPEEDFTSPLEPPLTRSIPAGPVARFFIAPLNFCYHLEHHSFPGLPYPSLPRLHRILAERGFYKANPEMLGSRYGAVLASLIRAQQQKDTTND
jgi:fatty acid desaturase